MSLYGVRMNSSENSEKLLEVARAEAKRLGHRYVGTEHLLLAVSRDPTVGEILTKLHLEPEDLQSQVDAFVISTGALDSDEVVPVSPRAQKALDQSIDEANALLVESPAPIHVLLALAGDEEGVAARVLEEFAIDYASIQRFLVNRSV